MPFVSGNFYLTQAQMEENALYIWNGVNNLELGWTMEAVAAMLGNMQTESTINPGIWEALTPTVDESNGYGLVQWTPARNYLNWCRSNGYEPSHMNSAILRIIYEIDNNLQWIPTTTYPQTFKEFLSMHGDVEDMAYMFLYNYERPGDLNQPARKTQARAWYEFLGGEPPPPPPPEKSRKLPLIYYVRRF